MYFRGEAADRFGGKRSGWSSGWLILLKFNKGSESSACEGADLHVLYVVSAFDNTNILVFFFF